jgi:hypothetical protein
MERVDFGSVASNMIAMVRPVRAQGSILFPLRAVARTFASSLLILIGSLLGTGCATPQAFVPLAEVRTAAPDGVHGAADYQLDRPSQRGHVQVWSRGAYRDDSEGPARTIVHIGFSLQNEGTTPLRLNEQRLFLEDIGSSEGGIQQLAPSRVEGNVAIAPSATGNVDAYFTLPRRIWPGDIFGYRVAWALAGEEQARVEHTTFESTRFRSRVYFAYDYPYYPWGWYYPWRPYPFYAPYPYWDGPAVYGPRVYVAPRVYVGPRAYVGPRVLARPRAR